MIDGYNTKIIQAYHPNYFKYMGTNSQNMADLINRTIEKL